MHILEAKQEFFLAYIFNMNTYSCRDYLYYRRYALFDCLVVNEHVIIS